MSVFRLPDTLINEIHSHIANFWWGRKDNKRSIHWLSWQRLCQSKELGGLGLRDLKVFNIAMLAKQVWKLMNNEHSLLFDVYKNLYFKDGDFMSAVPNTNASFSWRSILWARDHVKEGIQWCIGNGQTVRIISDKWVLADFPRKIYPVAAANELLLRPDSKVACLIDEVTGTWKDDLLNLFDAYDANAIRRIPLGRLEEDDFPRWPFTKHGCYSVKSGYHFVLQQISLQKASNSGCGQPATRNRIWKMIWSLKIAPKVKNFCWRLMSNALPCYENLSKRKVECDNWCPFCSAEDARLVHIFIHCPVATQVWALSFLGVHIKPQQANDIHEWVRYVFEHCNLEVIEQFSVILWMLWRGRNEIMFNRAKVDPLSLLQGAIRFWKEYKEANKSDIVANRIDVVHKWFPPPVGSWKINVDAASDGKGENGLGMIVRDAFGNFIFAKASHVRNWTDIDSLEACAVKIAVEWCKEMNLSRAIIESDSQIVIQMLKSKVDRRDYCKLFVMEALKMIRGDDISFEWCSRDGNRAAHLLANFARLNPGNHVWQLEAPAFLSQVLDEDMNYV